MSETRFTKAPWAVAGFGSVWAKDTMIAPMRNMPEQAGMYRAKSKEEHIANKHLIAAAPELYSLLEIAKCPQCDGSGAYYGSQGDACQCQWCCERQKALAKARGESCK